MEALIYRIRNKDRIMSLDELDKYEGIAYECAVCLRGIQKIIYRRELSEKAAVNADYSDLLRSAELLCFLSEHNIKSDEDFQNTINAYDEKYRKNKEELEDTENEKKLAERVISGTPRFLELKYKERFTPDELTEFRTYMDFFRLKIDSLEDAEEYRRRLPALENKVKELSDLADNSKKVRDNAAEQYKTYLEFKENTFGIFLEQKRQEELMRRELYRQQTYNTERHYNTHRSNSAR